MKNSILKLGNVLNKNEQKNINGGLFGSTCSGFEEYPVGSCNQCTNRIIPGGPTFCFNNCCIQAF